MTRRTVTPEAFHAECVKKAMHAWNVAHAGHGEPARVVFERLIRDAFAQVAQVYACDTDDGPLQGEESIVRRPRS